MHIIQGFDKYKLHDWLLAKTQLFVAKNIPNHISNKYKKQDDKQKGKLMFNHFRKSVNSIARKIVGIN